MKFKVGDKVRPTREHLINAIENNTASHLEYIDGFQVVKIEDNFVFYYLDDSTAYYKAEQLELVPEESEFTYGEEIEVSYDRKDWNQAIFLCKTLGNDEYPYIVATISKKEFDKGERFMNSTHRYARKLKLTRKQIAEKFGVSEDFTFVD